MACTLELIQVCFSTEHIWVVRLEDSPGHLSKCQIICRIISITFPLILKEERRLEGVWEECVDLRAMASQEEIRCYCYDTLIPLLLQIWALIYFLKPCNSWVHRRKSRRWSSSWWQILRTCPELSDSTPERLLKPRWRSWWGCWKRWTPGWRKSLTKTDSTSRQSRQLYSRFCSLVQMSAT